MSRIQRCLAVLAGLGGTLTAFAAAAPAAFAYLPPPGPTPANSRPQMAAWFWHPRLLPAHIFHQPVHQPLVPAPVRVVVSGGTPGWQITLSAATAALLAAVLAVLADPYGPATRGHNRHLNPVAASPLLNLATTGRPEPAGDITYRQPGDHHAPDHALPAREGPDHRPAPAGRT